MKTMIICNQINSLLKSNYNYYFRSPAGQVEQDAPAWNKSALNLIPALFLEKNLGSEYFQGRNCHEKMSLLISL